MANAKIYLSAIGDENKPVDWFFMYKVAGRSVVSNKGKAKGTEYVYFDSQKRSGQKLRLSPYQISDPRNGAISNTLNQIYNNRTHPDVGWFFYNDEDPVTGKTNGSRGHTKGVLCFNLATNSAFWLIHSAPRFPPKGKFSYPATAMDNAQTLLCITLKDADTAKSIAGQMIVAQQPNVYLASAIPAALKNVANDPRVDLLQNKVATGGKAYGNFISFTSKGGTNFRCIAKNKEWSVAAGDDFYNDLVGPVLDESIEVETWEHDPTPGSIQSDGSHRVMAMRSVDLSPLGIDPYYMWSEENDHAKLAISEQGQAKKYVCVGDLNFTIPQEKRSGGTVAFSNDDLWNSLIEILSSTNNRPKTAEGSGSPNTPSPVAKKKTSTAKAPPVAKKAASAKATAEKKSVPAPKKSVKKAATASGKTDPAKKRSTTRK